MLNYASEMARVYYALTNQPLTLIPTGHTPAYWAERCYRYQASLPDVISGGRNASFWLEQWYYFRTGQNHRHATGTLADWFWLAKLYDQVLRGANHNPNGQVGYNSAAFWANQLAGVPGLGGGSGVLNMLDSFFTSYSPLLRYKIEESSGTTIENTGSLGSAANGVLTLGAGSLGLASNTANAGNGIDCDSANTQIAIPNSGAISNLADFTLLIVARPDSAGEGSQGLLFTKINEFTFRSASTARIVGERNCATTNAVAISSANSFIYGNTYAFAFRYSDADKVCHLFVNGVETGYFSAPVTGVGTRAASASGASIASLAGAITFDGGIFDVALVDSALSDAEIYSHYEAVFF